MSNSTQTFPPASTEMVSNKVSTSGAESSSGNVTKRLTSELMSLMMSCPSGISAFPANDSDLTYWKGRIDGAEGTYYEGQSYAISLTFPSTYPFAAPTVVFESTCFRASLLPRFNLFLLKADEWFPVARIDPNVDMHGNICLDILKEKWSPMLSVSTILISIQSLLGEPNNKSPLNIEAADLWDDKEAFKKQLTKYYKPLEDEE